MKDKQLHNLILYAAGRLVSTLGSTIYSFAIGLYVLNTTGSGMKFAITLLISFLPSLILTPFAGVFADRFDKKKIVVNMDLLNGLLFIAFFIYISTFSITITNVYITTFLTNIITAFFGIAFEAAKPQLVKKEKFATINSLSQIISSVSNILGPVFGGFIYAFVDIKLFILFNGLSFILSAASELLIDFNFNHQEKAKEEKLSGVGKALKEGFDYIIKKKDIMRLYGFFLGVNILLAFAIQVPVPYILNNHLQVGSEAYGIIFGFLPVGMIVGALFVGKLIKQVDISILYRRLGILCGLITMMIGLPYVFEVLVSTKVITTIYYIVITFSFGLVISLVDVPFVTYLQNKVDASYLGRVWGILIPMVKVANPIGFLLAGFIIDFVNPFLIPLVSGLIFIPFALRKKKNVTENLVLEKSS